MARVFISYRRIDSAAWAGRIYERLSRDMKKSNIFMDVDRIMGGADFVSVLGDSLAKCEVLLCLIGPGWLNATNDKGRRRLDDSEDFVRIEVATALANPRIRVIPVLIDGASMPTATQLPGPLKPLAQRHAIKLAHDTFSTDSIRLSDVISGRTTSSPAAGTASPHARMLGWSLIALAGIIPLFLIELGAIAVASAAGILALAILVFGAMGGYRSNAACLFAGAAIGWLSFISAFSLDNEWRFAMYQSSIAAGMSPSAARTPNNEVPIFGVSVGVFALCSCLLMWAKSRSG